MERWTHWGSRPGSADFPLYDRILGIQSVALRQLLSPDVLERIQNNGLKADKGEQPLLIAEVFRSLTDGIWCDLPNGVSKDEKRTLASSVIRRNLQREHVKKLSTLVLGEKDNGDGELMFFFGGAGSSALPDAQPVAFAFVRDRQAHPAGAERQARHRR